MITQPTPRKKIVSPSSPAGLTTLKTKFGLPLLAASLVLGGAQQAFATSYSWINAKITTWSDTAAWLGGGAPVSDLDNVLTFSTSSNSKATNDLGTVLLNRLVATNSSSSNKTLTIEGNALNFVKNTGGVLPTFAIANNSASGGMNLSIPFTVTDALTVTNSGAKAVTVSGAITNTGGISFDGAGVGGITLKTGIVSGVGGITHRGSYTVSLQKANTYTGETKVSAGILDLGVANAVSSSSNVVLDGGSLQSAFSQTLGTLDLSASSTLDLSTAGTFVFADSASLAGSWAGTLSIIGTFTDGVSVKFGSSSEALTTGQLGQITINGLAATIDASGFLSAVAIPEPSSYATLLGLMTLGFVAGRRYCRKN
jgi:autotransporter-associated beta strand protein